MITTSRNSFKVCVNEKTYIRIMNRYKWAELKT